MEVRDDSLRGDGLPPNELLLLILAAETPPGVAPALSAPPPSLKQLGRRSNVADVVATAISIATSEIVSREVKLRAAGDSEDIHQARVATRRLRAQLRALRPVLALSWADHVNDELQWLAGALGEVRDADVIYKELEGQLAFLGDADALAAQQLLEVLLSERDAALARVQAVLGTERYESLVRELASAVVEPPLRPDEAGGSAQARSVLPLLVARRWAHLRHAVDALGAHPSDEALHEVRKQAKKLRYAAETAGPVVGKPARRLAAAAETLQAVLGEVHDAAVAEDWMRRTIEGGVASAGVLAVGDTRVNTFVAVVAGRLIERERQRYRANRDRWPKAWKAARKKKLRAWFSS